VEYGMIKSFKKLTPPRISFVLSDFLSWPAIVEIIGVIAKTNIVTVIFIGAGDEEFLRLLSTLGVRYKFLKKRNKYLSFLTFLMVFFILLPKQKLVYTSGQFATAMGILAAYLLNCPSRIFTRHHTNTHHYKSMRLGYFLDSLSNRLSTKIVAVSGVVENFLVSFENVEPGKVVIIYNGVDLEVFKNDPKLKDMDELSDLKYRINIGIAGRVTKTKGFIFTVEAFCALQKKYSNLHLHLVGTQSDESFNIAKTLSSIDPSSYTISGYESDMSGFLNRMDIFVHVPIGPYEESFGLVYLEALFSGVTCIFTKSGILNEIENIEDYAFFVPYSDSDSLIKVISEIIDGVYPKKAYLPKSLQIAYSQTRMTEKYCNLFFSQISEYVN
jgi:glycosyltransferase involved in cell wall biosynthesis